MDKGEEEKWSKSTVRMSTTMSSARSDNVEFVKKIVFQVSFEHEHPLCVGATVQPINQDISATCFLSGNRV